MADVVVGVLSMFVLVGLVFSFAGALDPAGDPVGWFQDKFDAAKRRLNR